MKQLGKWVAHSLIFVVLTVLTQVGGLIYLLCLPFFSRIKSGWRRFSLFTLIYSIFAFLIIPFIAPQFGRIPLSLSKSADLRPHSWWTCFLNRHYVRPELKATVDQALTKFRTEFPDQQVTYLDANFPFWNGFPLLPHISHSDGRKLDLAFLYINNKTKKIRKGGARSLTGYGVCEIPRKGELDQSAACHNQNRFYSFTKFLAWRGHPKNVEADSWRTSRLVAYLAEHKGIGKILLEPHLTKRWQLSQYSKIRAAGCYAVRHDDHIHIQL